MSAYSTFEISESGLSLTVHNTIEDRDELQLHTFSVSPASEQEVKRAFKSGLEKLKKQLNVSDLSGQLVAVRSTPSQLAWCRECVEEFGLEPHQILEPSIAYTSAFFEPVRDTITQEMEAWLTLIDDKPYLLEHTEISRDELQEVRDALLHQVMRVAVVGAMKAGKSTFLNALLGRYIMPAMDKRCTRRQFTLRNADDQGKQRRFVEVFTLSDDQELERNNDLSLDVDALNWSDDDLRAYLFALNSPDLFSASDDELDTMERQLKRDFELISFGNTRVQNSVRQRLKSEGHQISRIILTHPLYALTPETTGQMEFWDTPGPNAIETELREAQDQGESVVKRALSDRDTYLHALRRADALLVIFDVMQQEAESQDEIFRTVKERQGASGSVLLIANKVDQRQSRDAIPLDDVLAGIQRDAYERYDGMRLRKPIPNASKPAQLAREVTRVFNEHPDCSDIDELLDTYPDYESLIDDYEKSEDRRAKRFSRSKPWLGVEEFSGIKGTEQALGAFFKQETGRSVLRNCVKTLYQFLTENYEYTSRQLAGLTAERDDLARVREHLARGQVDLHELQTRHRDRFERIETSIKREIKERAQSYEREALKALDVKLTELYGSNPNEIKKSEFDSDTHQRDVNNMIQVQRVMIEEIIKTSDSLSKILSLVDEQAKLGERVKGDIDTELGLKFIYPKLENKSQLNHKSQSSELKLSFNTQRIKNQKQVIRGGDVGLAAGGVGGLALGLFLAPATGGLSLLLAGGAGLGLGAVAGGLAGEGIASVFADEETVESIHFIELNNILKDTLRDNLNQNERMYIEEIQEYLKGSFTLLQDSGQANLTSLASEITQIEEKINSPSLQDAIQNHKSDQDDLSRSVEAISGITRDLEIS